MADILEKIDDLKRAAEALAVTGDSQFTLRGARKNVPEPISSTALQTVERDARHCMELARKVAQHAVAMQRRRSKPKGRPTVTYLQAVALGDDGDC